MNLQDSAAGAEQMRSHLADFFGKPVGGLPISMDYVQAMQFGRTGHDISDNRDAVQAHLSWISMMSRNLDGAQVWVASPALTDAMTEHDLVTSSDGYLLEGASEAPAPVGLLHLPVPITGLSDLPIHGIAWDLAGTGEELQLSITALTETAGLAAALPPLLHPNHQPTSPYVPNAMVIAVPQVSTKIQSFGHHPSWGAAPTSVIVGLLLAFWDLRAVFEHDERTVAQRTGQGRKRRVKFRAVRVIREAATRHTGTPVPTGDGHHWGEATLRWPVEERWSWRCPNPRDHRAIIEAGGTCPKVRALVKEHVNGPRGRALDERRAVRITTVSSKGATSA
ncbi:hypothetical protein [Kitasatospora purpeofusca]|uniref:hypothetical protein n=1 Tax=Kitasatospora purpeofusca TaxID=67352 RepID=UPI0035D601C9